MAAKTGTFYGVSVGPGDPELLTTKALRILAACPVIAAPRAAGGEQLALSIARQAVDLTGKELLPLAFSMDRDEAVRKAAWQKAAGQVRAFLDRGRDVAMVVLGDVSIYATYCSLMEILQGEGYATEMIPGVTSFSAIAARLGMSLTTMEEPLHILPASQSEQWAGLDLPGTKILMKSGRNLGPLMEELSRRGLLDRASLVANCGLPGEVVCRDLRKFSAPTGYYTTVIVKE